MSRRNGGNLIKDFFCGAFFSLTPYDSRRRREAPPRQPPSTPSSQRILRPTCLPSELCGLGGERRLTLCVLRSKLLGCRAGCVVGCRKNLTDLTFAASSDLEEVLGDLNRFLLRVCLQDGEACNQLLRLRERHVGNRDLSAIEADPRPSCARQTALGGEQHAGLHAVFHEFLHFRHVLGARGRRSEEHT